MIAPNDSSGGRRRERWKPAAVAPTAPASQPSSFLEAMDKPALMMGAAALPAVEIMTTPDGIAVGMILLTPTTDAQKMMIATLIHNSWRPLPKLTLQWDVIAIVGRLDWAKAMIGQPRPKGVKLAILP